jgi:S1-C subfamily serine protease
MLRLLTIAATAGIAFTGGLLVANHLPAQSPAPAAIEQPAEAPAAQPARALPAAPLPDLSSVAERALKAAVNITSTRLVRTDPLTEFLSGQSQQRAQSLGSGVVVDPSGIILTNLHVIGDERAQVQVGLADGPDRPGRIVAVDDVTDLAVVKVEGRDLQTLPWGDSSKLRIAEWVLAIGNPFQLSGTVTLGIVSTPNRSAAEIGGISDYIQTDAAINPGNSGGALVNQRGELVGINTMIISQSGGYQGIGFAIPANTARRVMKELIEHGSVRWGSIGYMQLYDVSAAQARANGLGNAGGVLVSLMDPSSSAYVAGVRRGDLIVAVEGRPLADIDQLTREIITAPVGKSIRLDIVRRTEAGPNRTTIAVPVVNRVPARARR